MAILLCFTIHNFKVKNFVENQQNIQYFKKLVVTQGISK